MRFKFQKFNLLNFDALYHIFGNNKKTRESFVIKKSMRPL